MGIVLLAMHLFRSPPEGAGQAQLTCDSCGRKWDARTDKAARCPSCDGDGFVSNWYQCPTCQHVFLGMHAKRVDEITIRCRLPGDKEWSGPIHALTCPRDDCGKPIIDLLSAKIHTGYDAPPADKISKDPRAVQ